MTAVRNKRAYTKSFGITWSSPVNGYILRLGQRRGVNKFTGEKFPYYTRFYAVGVWGGKGKALAACQADRDKVLARPEFIRYFECSQYRLRLKQGKTITGIAGVGLNSWMKYCKDGSEYLQVSMRVLYRYEIHAMPTPRQVSLFISFSKAVALRDSLCGSKKKNKEEVAALFDAFLKKNKRRVNLMVDHGIAIWPDELTKAQRAKNKRR